MSQITPTPHVPVTPLKTSGNVRLPNLGSGQGLFEKPVEASGNTELRMTVQGKYINLIA